MPALREQRRGGLTPEEMQQQIQQAMEKRQAEEKLAAPIHPKTAMTAIAWQAKLKTATAETKAANSKRSSDGSASAGAAASSSASGSEP